MRLAGLDYPSTWPRGGIAFAIKAVGSGIDPESGSLAIMTQPTVFLPRRSIFCIAIYATGTCERKCRAQGDREALGSHPISWDCRIARSEARGPRTAAASSCPVVTSIREDRARDTRSSPGAPGAAGEVVPELPRLGRVSRVDVVDVALRPREAGATLEWRRGERGRGTGMEVTGPETPRAPQMSGPVATKSLSLTSRSLVLLAASHRSFTLPPFSNKGSQSNAAWTCTCLLVLFIKWMRGLSDIGTIHS
jgi:hypothetical protein